MHTPGPMAAVLRLRPAPEEGAPTPPPRTPEEVDATLDAILTQLEEQSTTLNAIADLVKTQGQMFTGMRKVLDDTWTHAQAEASARALRDEALHQILGDLIGRMGNAGLV